MWAVVLNWRDTAMTERCVRALEACGYPDLEILIVDNGSGDGSAAHLATTFPNLHHLALEENLGYAGGNAAGMLRALEEGADAVLVVNNDCLVTPGFLEPLVEELLEHPTTGAAGPVQRNWDGGRLVWANAGSKFDISRAEISPDGPSGPEVPEGGTRAVVDFHCGACLLFRADALREVGPYDPRLFLFSEEPDWSLRARARGWETVVLTSSVVDHLESKTTSRVPAAVAYYLARNPSWLVRRYGSRQDMLRNAVRTLFRRVPRSVAGHLLRGRIRIARACLAGGLAGVFADCRLGERPEDAAPERRYELVGA